MQTINIKICTTKQKTSPHQFFILSKGNNAGKPLIQPCANCFVVTCNDEKKCELLYWLSYALWQSGKCRQHLVGSVIEFLHVRDIRTLLRNAYNSCETCPEVYMKFAETLQFLLKYEETISAQLEKVRSLKVSIAIDVIKNLPV